MQDDLTVEPERLLRGGKHTELGAAHQKLAEHGHELRDDVLTVVEHEPHRTSASRTAMISIASRPAS